LHFRGVQLGQGGVLAYRADHPILRRMFLRLTVELGPRRKPGAPRVCSETPQPPASYLTIAPATPFTRYAAAIDATASSVKPPLPILIKGAQVSILDSHPLDLRL
jgi:hypothetical protein